VPYPDAQWLVDRVIHRLFAVPIFVVCYIQLRAAALSLPFHWSLCPAGTSDTPNAPTLIRPEARVPKRRLKSVFPAASPVPTLLNSYRKNQYSQYSQWSGCTPALNHAKLPPYEYGTTRRIEGSRPDSSGATIPLTPRVSTLSSLRRCEEIENRRNPLS